MKLLVEETQKLLNNIDKNTLRNFNKNISIIEISLSNKTATLFDKNIITTNLSKSYIDSLVLNHLHFVKKVFYLKNSKLFIEQLFWEISTYNKMGIPYKFFKYLLKHFLDSICKLEQNNYSSIIELYKYLLSNYDYIIKESKSFRVDEKVAVQKDIYEEFLNALLKPSLNDAIKISDEFIKDTDDLKLFWEDILLCALYTIGSKWANGEISVGQEHTATSICQRVISIHYEKILENSDLPNEKVAIIVSPFELHEIGARMISDLLEFHNYETYFFGSKSTLKEIVEVIKDEDIKNILISTTLVSNLDATKEMIANIKNELDNISIYVGGQAYNCGVDIVNDMKADKYIDSFDVLLNILREENHD
ncbi:MAG: cobalamin B12-binding domain-containing protein [Campylobacterota bacterium]